MASEQKTTLSTSLPEVWNEELFRSARYREAAQKRTEEKKSRREMEGLKKDSHEGRLKTEP